MTHFDYWAGFLSVNKDWVYRVCDANFTAALNLSFENMSNSKEDYIFFWKPQSVHGWATQWHKSNFTASLSDAVEGAPNEPYTFPTAEHWMMACKAAFFGDTSVLNLVLEDMSHPNPAAVKAMGRRITSFDEDAWVEVREEIVYKGNLYKFRQDEELKQILLGTGDKIIVEASPSDAIWGIGLSEAKALSKRDGWGLNLLGKALMAVRQALREEEKSAMDTT
jgi:ribA/ribD-fused uncharacterized protein